MNDFFRRLQPNRPNNSSKGIVFGIILFILAFPLLWWNEGRSVERYNALKEGLDLVILVASDTVNAANDGKLIHTSGTATTQETLVDEAFLVSAPAIKLQRNVSMYQWKQTGVSKSATRHDYKKDWSDKAIDSSHFKYPAEHGNPEMAYKNRTFQAQNVSLGAFKLSNEQINRLAVDQDLTVQGIKIPKQLAGKKLTLTETGLYLGDNPAEPQIGDLKISFKILKPSKVSVIAQQQGNNFTSYINKTGSDVDLLTMGIKTAKAMFVEAQQQNTFLTWEVRICGFLLMWSGLYLIFKPLSVIASTLPYLGELMTMGISLLAFLFSLPCALIIIAISWLVYRPLLAGILIIIAIAAISTMKFIPKKIS